MGLFEVIKDGIKAVHIDGAEGGGDAFEEDHWYHLSLAGQKVWY